MIVVVDHNDERVVVDKTITSQSLPLPGHRLRNSKEEKNCFCENILLILTISSVFAGVVIGFSLRHTEPSVQTIQLIGFPGELFMNMLKLLIVPLLAASLISGLSQMDTRTSGRVTAWAFVFYILTLSLAVALGIILVLIIHPGDSSIKAYINVENENARNISAVEKVLDLLRNMFSDNIIRATFQQVETDYRLVPRQRRVFIDDDGVNSTSNMTMVMVPKPYIKYTNGMNALGLIVFFIGVGLIMGNIGAPARPLADVFVSLDLVITKLVGVIMWYSPIGIASLISSKILEITDLTLTAQTLGMYMLTVIIGLFLHLFVVLPVVLFAASGRNPYKFLRGMSQAALTAFGTASSAATLPITFKCVEENNGVNPKYTKFVLPVGAIINMDGTALYEAVASVFIAQINGMSMDIGNMLLISVTAALASIGAASIPSAGLVTMLIVLSATGLPADDVTLIIAVDWFLDRLRTVVNVMGDAFGCGFVEAMMERAGRESELKEDSTQDDD